MLAMNKQQPLMPFLLVRPSLLEGMARVLDIGGQMRLVQPFSLTTDDDWQAIARDWQAVGDDLRQACEQFDAANDISSEN